MINVVFIQIKHFFNQDHTLKMIISKKIYGGNQQKSLQINTLQNPTQQIFQFEFLRVCSDSPNAKALRLGDSLF